MASRAESSRSMPSMADGGAGFRARDQARGSRHHVSRARKHASMRTICKTPRSTHCSPCTRCRQRPPWPPRTLIPHRNYPLPATHQTQGLPACLLLCQRRFAPSCWRCASAAWPAPCSWTGRHRQHLSAHQLWQRFVRRHLVCTPDPDLLCGCARAGWRRDAHL